MRRRESFKRSVAAVLIQVLILTMVNLSGCGKQSEPVLQENIVGDVAQPSPEKADKSEAEKKDETPLPVEEEEVYEYPTENTIIPLETMDYSAIEVSISNYCDQSAIDWAKENNAEDHLLWLSDYVVNCIEPQAVQQLLQIPVLAEAAENGEISKYISIYLTYNDVNQFGAMEQTCYLGKNGHGLEKWDSPMYYIGHKIFINLESFGVDFQKDYERMSFLESSMIHELMHAFMTDYLFNLSLGTGRDGCRVLKRDQNAKVVLDEYDNPVLLDVIPDWLQEGVAETVENGFGTRREELKGFFDSSASQEEYLNTLSDPKEMMYWISGQWTGEETENVAKVTQEDNTYSLGYVASLFLYSMEAEKMGYTVFDDGGYINMEALLNGLNQMLKEIHGGKSLDDLIADISYNSDKGTSVYADTTDFEQKFLQSIDDPGLLFWQKLMYDFEQRSWEYNDDYVPSGSVLPGYVNCMEFYTDSAYHPPAKVYRVNNINENNPAGDYFSISTIRMSNVALGGGRRTTYDPVRDALTDAELEERDKGYLGNEQIYIDLSLED